MWRSSKRANSTPTLVFSARPPWPTIGKSTDLDSQFFANCQFAETALMPKLYVPQGLVSKKNLLAKLKFASSYLLTYLFIGYPYPVCQPFLHRLTPIFWFVVGTCPGVKVPIFTEIKKYLAVLPVPNAKTAFSKTSDFPNLFIFFVEIQFL